ncbi:MAG TPA: isoprenylcysteine carboxylmethyltransferase family protein [Micropepsaceae bacterium]|jgi:protein-S-isoprenylcysteine O-methyltransferase Ste14|nr:isoprenylcysteine carboxylmethyltransferase family protein [Micropepsaceae bacterium]
MAPPRTTPAWYLKIPPPIWMFALLLVAYATQRSFAWAQIVYFRSLPLATVLAVAGISLAAWGRSAFAAAGTEIIPTSPSNKTLVTGGPFRFTRNPMYSGLVLASLGVALYPGTLPFFAVPIVVFLLCNLVFIPFEEAKMQRQFNDQYTDYLHRVRRWI